MMQVMCVRALPEHHTLKPLIHPPAAKPQATHTPIDGEPSRPSRAGEEISDNHLHPWPMDHLVESQMPPGDPSCDGGTAVPSPIRTQGKKAAQEVIMKEHC